MAFQCPPTGWHEIEGQGWRPGEGQEPARRPGAHEPIPASPGSCGSVRGCGRRRRYPACRGFPERGPPPPTRLAPRA